VRATPLTLPYTRAVSALVELAGPAAAAGMVVKKLAEKARQLGGAK